MKIDRERLKLKNIQLEAVARERLMTQQTGKGLGGAMVICRVWKLAIAL
jgi:hypothetical protein